MLVKNSMPYIMASLQSFLEQDYKNKELIIVYSKSNDGSFEYLNDKKTKNIKIYYLNKNLYSCLNYGIKKSKGDVIGILHSDDILHDKNVLSDIAKSFKKEKADIVYGNIMYSKRNQIFNIIRVWNNIKLNNKYDLPPHTSTFVKRKLYNNNFYNPNYKISSDTNFLLNIFKKNQNKNKYFYLNKYITIMRTGGISTKIFYVLSKLIEDIDCFKKNNLSFIYVLKKTIIKTKQIFIKKKLRNIKYINKVEDKSRIDLVSDPIEFLYKNKKILSALNMAYLAYNSKYKLRRHFTAFWMDGVFGKFIKNQNKKPGREILLKFIKFFNKKNTYKIYTLGTLTDLSKKWLDKNLNRKFTHLDLPKGSIEKIIDKIKYYKFARNSFLIIIIPTPKQEIIANYLISKNPNVKILCIGGSLNIVSGEEKTVPKLLNNLNLEWLWRLRYDSKRRISRLCETFFITFKLFINKNNSIY